MAYALIFPLSECISQMDFQLLSTVQVFRGAELHQEQFLLMKKHWQ